MSNIRSSEASATDSIFIERIEILPIRNGSLDNLTFAVKDVIDIKNHKTSCGNPTWLYQQIPAADNAACVKELLSNGAKCLGKTVLGEFCSGSTGVNHFYGMPPNPKATTRVPGGSSSGSASAVASGIVDFALGTDAAGSTRLPASFCGVYGLRPSHGAISMQGVKSFAPSFDTLGIFANDINIVSKAYEVLTGSSYEQNSTEITNFYVISDLMLLIPNDQRIVLEKFINEACEALHVNPTYINLTDIHPDANHPELGMSAIFKKLFCAEIWETLGEWIEKVKLEFHKDTFVDFSYMKSVAQTDLTEEIARRRIYTNKLQDLLIPGSLLCIPSSPNLPPLRNKNYSKVNEFDYEKLRPLVCLSSLGQLPQINIPLESLDKAPLGVSLLAGRNQDLTLINTVMNICDLNRTNKPKGFTY